MPTRPRKRTVHEDTSTSGYAIASFVLGFAFFIPFMSVLAVLFGFLALDDLKKRPRKGKELAYWGIGLGIFFAVVKIILILLGILFFVSLAGYASTL